MMLSKRGPFERAAALLLIAALFHLKLVFFVGFTQVSVLLFGIGVSQALVAWGLFKAWRWLARIVYLPVAFDFSFGMALSMEASGFNLWWFGIMAACSLATFVALFVALWRPPMKS